MGTYDHKKVINDYEHGFITPEQAIGHGLQHIGKLYEAQTAANLSRSELRSIVDSLSHAVSTLQANVERLTTRLDNLTP